MIKRIADNNRHNQGYGVCARPILCLGLGSQSRRALGLRGEAVMVFDWARPVSCRYVRSDPHAERDRQEAPV